MLTELFARFSRLVQVCVMLCRCGEPEGNSIPSGILSVTVSLVGGVQNIFECLVKIWVFCQFNKTYTDSNNRKQVFSPTIRAAFLMGQPETFKPVQFQLHHEVGHWSRDSIEPNVLTKSTHKQQERWEEKEESKAPSSCLQNTQQKIRSLNEKDNHYRYFRQSWYHFYTEGD